MPEESRPAEFVLFWRSSPLIRKTKGYTLFGGESRAMICDRAQGFFQGDGADPCECVATAGLEQYEWYLIERGSSEEGPLFTNFFYHKWYHSLETGDDYEKWCQKLPPFVAVDGLGVLSCGLCADRKANSTGKMLFGTYFLGWPDSFHGNLFNTLNFMVCFDWGVFGMVCPAGCEKLQSFADLFDDRTGNFGAVPYSFAYQAGFAANGISQR